MVLAPVKKKGEEKLHSTAVLRVFQQGFRAFLKPQSCYRQILQFAAIGLLGILAVLNHWLRTACGKAMVDSEGSARGFCLKIFSIINNSPINILIHVSFHTYIRIYLGFI